MSSPGGETDDILRLGDKFYDEKLYSLAVEQYEKFLKVQPDHEKASHALFRLGHSYFFMGNFGRASEYFDTYLKRYPKDALVAAVLFKQAQSLFELKRYAEAAPCFARVFDEYTSSPSAQEALYRSGLSFYRDNAFDKAREQLTKFFDRYPKGPLAADALAALAGMALADGEKDNAIQYLQQCVSGFPGRTDLLPRIHYRLAAIYRDIDNKDLAIKEYQIALAAADTLAPGYGMLAEFSDYLYEKKLWGACADLTRRYIEKMAGQAAPAYYFRLPEAFFYAGQYRKAADEYDTFVLRYPDTSAVSLAKFTIAQCYVMLRQNETAIEYLEELAQRFANDRYGARAIRLMGDLYYGDSLYLNAVNMYRKYLRSTAAQDRDSVAFRIAAIYEKEFGKNAYAVSEYQKFIQEYPFSELLDDAQFAIGRCEEATGNYPVALVAFDRLVENYPSSPFAVEAGERMEYIRNYLVKDYSAAMERFTDIALTTALTDELRYFAIADIFEFNLKEFGKAIVTLEDYRKEYPNSPALASVGFRIGQLYEKLSQRAALESNPQLAAQYRDKALAAYRMVIKDYPADTLVDDINLKLLKAAKAPLKEFEDFLSVYPKSGLFPEVSCYVAQHYIESAGGRDDKRITLAIERYRKAIEFDSRGAMAPRAYFGMGKCYLLQGNPKAAEFQFQQVIQTYPQHALASESHYILGEIARADQKFADALGWYRKLMYKFPFSAFTELSALRSADCLYFQKEITGALKQYRNFLASYPKSAFTAEAQAGLGGCYEYMEKTDAAIREYRVVDEQYSAWQGVGAIRLRLARLYRSSGDNRQAVAYFRKVLDADSLKREHASALAEFGEVLYDLSNFREAETCFKRGLAWAAAPQDSVKAWSGYIRCLIIEGNTKEAKTQKSLFKDRFSNEKNAIASMYFTEGMYLINRSSYEKAEKRFFEIVDDFSGTDAAPDAVYFQAFCRYQQGSRAEALDLFRKFLQQYPGHRFADQARFACADILEQLGDLQKAADAYAAVAASRAAPQKLAARAVESGATVYGKINAWKKAYELRYFYGERTGFDKLGVRELIQLGFLATQSGDFPKALEWFTVAGTKAGADQMAEVTYWIAKCAASTGDDQKAIVEYLKVPFLYKDGGMWGFTAKLEAAQLYEKIGDMANARNIYEQIVSADTPEGRFGRVAAARIKRIEIMAGNQNREKE
ncbi:MAG: hypothetical protein A2268_16885 [Candidatus Raymondbacteria bacterium RifOxyA12_full_50_37]|nr:MAG: hypothetical protein A2268_16885 [Candidatus Raymondbacteria bacterium RifOxyA12_full_50_37]OGJ86286.1 MAG: hypothetical protein A2248_16480 [Candidatus Raymondbacteria bacterium RIFOXYA2_FULL_49_16]OGP42738.1 MAG: hypothetical protein A2324_00895 [Candidatus Raymondbacteria bacterium RIFOXYB2_FULL_49_35]